MGRLIDTVRIGCKKDGKIYIAVIVDGESHSFTNGKLKGHSIDPNKYTSDARVKEGKALMEQKYFLIVQFSGLKYFY